MTITKESIGGFRTLWLRYEAGGSDRNQLFIKEHSARNKDAEYPRGRTLFAVNIPPYATEDSVKHAFSKKCGPVKTVIFATSPGNPEKFTYVVFEKESGLDKALSLSRETILNLSSSDNPLLTGLKKWCKEYNESICDETDTKKKIEQYMEKYDQRIAERLEREKTAEEGDADGWIQVTGRKKRGEFALARKESTINKLQNKLETSIRKKQLQNFYSFQIREAKKQNLVELRKKFELDKKKLQQMKQIRTFKPF